MGCSSSKLDEEVAVKTCHDRRSFVKIAVAQRSLLASSHVAYVQSLRRVSLALFYYFAEDEHLYLLHGSSCQHHPGSPERVVVAAGCLRPGGAPVYPMEQWDQPEDAETVTVDGLFGVDHHFFHHPSPPPPPPARWDSFWDPFSSPPDHHRYANCDVEVVRSDLEDQKMPELEEITDDEEDGGGDREGGEAEEAEQAEAATPEAEEKAVDVSNELRVLATSEIEQQSTPGFTVYVDRPPASMAEAVRDIQGHFMKVADTAVEVSALLEVVPYKKRVQPPSPRADGGDKQGGAGEVPPETFELFKSHKESLDRLYEWEKRLYEEVRAGERVRLSYEKKYALLQSQDANGAEPFAIERTMAAIRDLRSKLSISLTSADAVSRRIDAVRDDELLPQLAQIIRGLARMWRVIADAHRVIKRTADEAIALLSSSAPAAAGDQGGVRGPPPPPGPTRAATAAGALAAELRGWRAAVEAWAESQRGYAAALWGWSRSCVKDGEDMPSLLVAWARAVDAVDVDAAAKALEAVAAEAAAVAVAAKRRSGEKELNEQEGKRKVCIALAAALAAVAEVGGMASTAYDELVVEMEETERGREMAGRDEAPVQS